MPLHLRVELPDRPGMLAQLTGSLAKAGADVLSLTVTDRLPGRAVDDFLLRWPSGRPPEDLTSAVLAVPGCRVLGLRRVATVPGEAPALDLIRHLLRQPHRAMECFVDMLPTIAGAEWAVALASDNQCVYRSARAPDDLPGPAVGTTLSRAVAVDVDGLAGLSVPVPGTGMRVQAWRPQGPPFLRREIDEVMRLAELAVAVLAVALPGAAQPASELTASVTHVASLA